MESALDWMKKFEMKKFQYRKTLNSEKMDPITSSSSQEKPTRRESTGQKTLKAFLPTKANTSELFDDTFNQADFARMTRRWKDKNAEHVAAR